MTVIVKNKVSRIVNEFLQYANIGFRYINIGK